MTPDNYAEIRRNPRVPEAKSAGSGGRLLQKSWVPEAAGCTQGGPQKHQISEVVYGTTFQCLLRGAVEYVFEDLWGSGSGSGLDQNRPFFGSRPGPSDMCFLTTLTHLAPLSPP